MIRWLPTAMVAAAVVAGTAWAQDVRVRASVNANRIGVQDVLQLTVSVSGGGNRNVEPQLPAMGGFRVAGRSTSSRVQIINGQMSSTVSYVYQLLPQKEGTFTIGPVRVEHGGETHETEPITVEVVAGSVAPTRRGRGASPLDDPFPPFGRRRQAEPQITEEDVFVTVELSKDAVYQGEPLVLTYRLYSRFVPLGSQVDDDPPLTGFWVEEIDLGRDAPAERRTVRGREYIALPVKQRVVLPTKPGSLDIPPITISTAFRVSSNDIFDSFFGRASQAVSIRSQPATLTVKPLPEKGRDPDFSGAVGEYELSAELNENETEAGEPVTLTIAVRGEGSLRAVEPPELPTVPGFRVFDPKVDHDIRADALGLRASKTWEYVLVPESGGVKELGPWSFQYFDPSKGQYVTATAEALELAVSGANVVTAEGASTPAARGDVQILRQDIRFLKAPPETLGATTSPFHESPWFYLSLALPILWNLGFVVYLRRKEKERTHSHLFRSRRAHRMARARLKEAAKLAREGSKGFYEEVAAALYRYVGDKMGVSPSGLTTQRIDRLLAERDVPQGLRDELLGLLEECEEARFTPGERSRAQMEKLRDRTEDWIVSVDKHL